MSTMMKAFIACMSAMADLAIGDTHMIELDSVMIKDHGYHVMMGDKLEFQWKAFIDDEVPFNKFGEMKIWGSTLKPKPYTVEPQPRQCIETNLSLPIQSLAKYEVNGETNTW